MRNAMVAYTQTNFNFYKIEINISVHIRTYPCIPMNAIRQYPTTCVMVSCATIANVVEAMQNPDKPFLRHAGMTIVHTASNIILGLCADASTGWRAGIPFWALISMRRSRLIQPFGPNNTYEHLVRDTLFSAVISVIAIRLS
jgi:hypothetical protein